MNKKLLGGLLTVITLTTLVGCSSGSGSKDTSKKENHSAKVEKKRKETKKETPKKEASEDKSSDKKSSNQDALDIMAEAAQSQVATIKKQSGDTFSDITVKSAANDTLVYTYVLKNKVPQMDSAALKPTLVKQMKSVMGMVTSSVPDAKMQFIYLNPDKSEVANITVTQDDVNKLSDSATSNETK